jgi:hypothetical protein
VDEQHPFDGFLPPISSTTYCPNQFFDVVLRRGSRGAVRLVSYLIRKTLGWSDAHGRPQEPQAVVSWRELETRAGIGHSSIAAAVQECIDARYIVCVRPGRPDRAGEPSASACYELRWDEREAYITDPDRFGGFYAGNGNLTYIPNQYFDLVVPNESLSVLRIVGAIIRHTIGYQTRYGFRRQEVSLSHAALERYANLSHEAVRLAVQEAVAHRYVVCVEPGAFDTNAGKESRPATYGIRWRDGWNGQCSRSAESPQPAEGLRAADSPKSCSTPEGPLRNVVRDRSDSLHGDRSERLHGREITEKNTSKQQQASLDDGHPAETRAGQQGEGPPAAAAGHSESSSEPTSELRCACAGASTPAFGLLIDAGFDTATARRLAKEYPFGRIARQCAWLPQRNPHRNKLGLLRRAIEEDWPEPAAATKDDSPAALLAAAYYNFLAGAKPLTATRPSAADLSQAAQLVERVAGAGCDAANPAGWGTDLATLVRRSEYRPGRAPGSLAAAIATHGDNLLYLIQERRKKAERQGLVEVRRRHQAMHQSAYLAYLRACRDHLRSEQGDAYRLFEEMEHRRRKELQEGFVARVGLSERMLQAFDREEDQLTRFWLFFAKHAEHPVLDFWAWDEQHNPDSFAPTIAQSSSESLPACAKAPEGFANP